MTTRSSTGRYACPLPGRTIRRGSRRIGFAINDRPDDRGERIVHLGCGRQGLRVLTKFRESEGMNAS